MTSLFHDEKLLRKAISESSSIRGVFLWLGLSKNSNYDTFYRAVQKFNIEIPPEWKQLRALNLRCGREGIPLEEILVKNSTYSTTKLKNRLLRDGLLQNLCSRCGQEPCWQDQPLTLQLDHINGDPLDNRIENLRILCPHCHTQTKNYAGKNKKKQAHQNFCIECKSKISKTSIRCSSCFRSKNSKRLPKERNPSWPSKEQLSVLIWNQPMREVAKAFGVSDVTIKKWCIAYEIEVPPRGYWIKKQNRTIV